MKTILFLIHFSSWLIPAVAAQKPLSDSVDVTILLKNKKINVDSVYVIFDRYDLTGAGVVKKVFYPSDNRIVIENVPKGKYYVDVYCIGIDHQNISRVSRVGKRRSNKLSVPFKTFEPHIPGTAVIPPSSFNLSNLAITKESSYK